MNLKRIHIWVVLAMLLLPSAWCSWQSYNTIKSQWVADMNQALEKTLAEQTSVEITPDTQSSYLSYLTIPALRDRSFVAYAVPCSNETLCSAPLYWSDVTDCEFQGYASCSFLSLWVHSDQRWSFFFLGLSALWFLGATFLYKRQLPESMVRLGGITLRHGVFYNRLQQPIHLTPMQEQLLMLFFSADSHRLSKQEICDALWPRKPDASDTLYTLIKRLKPIVEEHGDLQISSERGKEYILESK